MPLAPLLQQLAVDVDPATLPNFPELIVKWGATSSPLQEPQEYEDITQYVRWARWSRGRPNESSRPSAGTLQMRLDNRNRHFDPTTNSNVRLDKRIVVQAVWRGVIYDQITVFADAWDQNYPGFGFDAEVHVRGTDAFKRLALYEIDDENGYFEQPTGQQARRILTEGGFSFGQFVVEPGATIVSESGPLPNVTRLNRLLDLADTEGGLFFVAANGKPTFHGRHHRILQEKVVRGTLDAESTSIRYRNLVGRFDDADYWTRVTVTPVGGEPETAFVTGSVFPRTLSRTSLAASQEEAAAQAAYLANHFGVQALRFDQVEVVGAKNTDAWPLILAAEISWRFVISHQPFSLEYATDPDDPDAGPQPVDPGPPLTSEQYIEGIECEVTPGTGWSHLFRLSPADTQDVFIWDESTWDVDTRWGY